MWFDCLDERSDVSPGVFDGSLLGLPHPVLDLGESLLDRVEIGAVGREEEQPGACCADCAAHGLALVAAQVVHDDDVAGFQRRHEHLFDIEQESLAVDRPVDEPRRLDPVVAQGGDEGGGLPIPMRGLRFKPLTAWRPAEERGHVGLGPGLIDEDEAGRIDPPSILGPLRSAVGDIGAIPFAGNQRLFLCVNPSA